MRAIRLMIVPAGAAVVVALALGSGAVSTTGPAARPPATKPADRSVDDVRIVLLHVNDTHGQTRPWRRGEGSWGGYARLATKVAEARRDSDAERVFLLHAGDVLSRGDDLTRKTLGAANVVLLNRLGFDAWTPGNGEYYDGVANLRKRIDEAKFPVLTANVKLVLAGQHLGRPYAIERAGPVKVAFFGLCLVRTVSPSALGLAVEDPIRTARRLVPELRKRADLVVALTHIGLEADTELAKQVPGIDILIGGHSHTKLPEGRLLRQDGGDTLIAQAKNHLEFLGRVDVQMRRKEGGGYRVLSAAARLLPLDDKVALDPETAALIDRLGERAAKGEPPAPTTRPATTQPASASP